MGSTMAEGKKRRGREKRGGDALPRFVGLFESRGWLNRTLRITRRGVSYRVFCSHTEFHVYRVNENACVPPGVPGWPVCMVGRGEAFHDTEVDPFSSSEPGALDWLRFIAEGDFEAPTELP